jgi:hypothetical protein
MPTLEECVADLEGRMKPDLREEMIRGFERMREDMTRGSELLRAEMTRGSELLRAEMTKGSELLSDEMARGFERTESRFERLESRVDRIEDRMHRQFTWIVGIQLTTMVTVIGVLAAAFLRT